MKILLDGYGGDNAPLAALEGAVRAVAAYGYEITLCGREAELRALAAERHYTLDGIEILDAPDVMSMHDEPRSILKAHKDSSMAVGLRALAAGEGDAFVSAGSTGALLMGATFFVKRIKGISRPALAPLVPSNNGPFMLIDSGANVDCRPEMLFQFAQMGSAYMTHVVLGGREASIGLLNVGTEDTKGGELQHEAFSLLKDSGLRFVGNIEARQAPDGACDVLVADGFSGNVLLKSMEGTADMLLHNIKDILLTNLRTKIGALLIKPYLGALKKKMSTEEYGGAPLLGVQKPVVKAHGNATGVTLQHAIRAAATFAETGVIGRIADTVAAHSDTATEEPS